MSRPGPRVGVNTVICTSHCKVPPSMSSTSSPNLAGDTRSLTISRGRARAAICTRPIVLKLSTLILATRCRCFIRAWTIGTNTFVGTGIASSVKPPSAGQPLLHLISIIPDACRFGKPKSSSHSFRRIVSTNSQEANRAVKGYKRAHVRAEASRKAATHRSWSALPGSQRDATDCVRQ
jgi:hypothetical protein